MNSPPLPDAGALGPLANPLAGWPNDDLLFEQEHRDFVARRHPEAEPIFDWPELREKFGAHDPAAGLFRKRSRRFGMVAVALGCASLLLTAFLGVISQASPEATRYLGALAALLALASGVTGYSGVLSGRDKWRWLTHRFGTERMRQLHFQLIVNNLPLAAEVVADPSRFGEWRKLRADALDCFEHDYMGALTDSMERMRNDLAESRPWLDDRWARAPAAPPASPALTELFQILKEQRFGIQMRYATFKLMPGVHSPRTRARAVRAGADVMTVLALLASAAAGILYFRASASPALPLVVGAGGGLAALVLGLRVIDEGLQLRSETERYEWYLAAVQSLERRFRKGDDEAKVDVLREMERLSYQELRWFTVSFSEARFVL